MQISLFLFLGACFLLVFLIGPLIEKARVPWIFAALLIGAVLAVENPVPKISDDPAFSLLANLGMYLLLFITGMEVDLSEMKNLGKLIVRTALVTILLATLFGTLFIHYVFETDWMVAMLVSLSFATVGEAILIPILDEFKIIHSRLGQAIIGVATLDDAFELFTLIWLSTLLGTGLESEISLNQEMLVIFVLVAFSAFLFLIKRLIPKVEIPNYQGLVVFFMLIVFFIYVGIGELAGIEALAAILAGVVVKYFVTQEQFKGLGNYAKLLTYGFLGPIFFLKVGMDMNMAYLVDNLLVVIALAALSLIAKLVGSVTTARNVLGLRQSILMGLALSIRFSTSIIIITILYRNGFIDEQLFSVIIATSIIFKFIIPPLFANLLVKWRVALIP